MTLNLLLTAAAVCGLLLGGLKWQTVRLRRVQAQLAACEQALAAANARLAAARARADTVAAVGRMDDAAVRQGLADANDYRD